MGYRFSMFFILPIFWYLQTSPFSLKRPHSGPLLDCCLCSHRLARNRARHHSKMGWFLSRKQPWMLGKKTMHLSLVYIYIYLDGNQNFWCIYKRNHSIGFMFSISRSTVEVMKLCSGLKSAALARPGLSRWMLTHGDIAETCWTKNW